MPVVDVVRAYAPPPVCATAKVLVAIVGGLAGGWPGLLEQPALASGFAAVVLVSVVRRRWLPGGS